MLSLHKVLRGPISGSKREEYQDRDIFSVSFIWMNGAGIDEDDRRYSSTGCPPRVHSRRFSLIRMHH